MAQDVLGLGFDQLRCFEHSGISGVLVLQGLSLFVGEFAEPPIEQIIHLRRASHSGVAGAALIEDRHS